MNNRFKISKTLVFFLLLTIAACSGLETKKVSPPLPTEQRSFDSQQGQFNGDFPQELPSNRKLINQRRIFRGYQNHGIVKITTDEATNADILINGKNISKGVIFVPGESLELNIGKVTKNGYNILRVKNIIPLEASINLVIPFPTLQKAPTESTGFSKQKLSEIDQLINKEIKQGFAGAILLISKQGKIIKHTAYGFSHRYDRFGNQLSNPTLVTKDTLFDLASNTKMYATNFAIMKLTSEGRLNVNLPVSNYLTEYRGDGRETRLVKDLLTHSAGYPPFINFQDENNDYGVEFFSQDKHNTQRLLIEEVPFQFERGIKSVYSDIDYLLLGTLVERIVAMPLDEYVEKFIYHPLGLSKTVFNPLDKGFSKQQIAATELQGNTRGGRVSYSNIRQDVVHGQVHDGKAYYSMQGVAGHAGLFSTAEDIAILANVILNRGGYGETKLFNKDVIDQFLKPSDLDITMGLGWRRAGNGERQWQFGPYASPYAIGHTGWTGTVTIIDPLYDLVIVLLTNKKHSVIHQTKDGFEFAGDTFETGKYGSIISLVYEAFLEN